MKLIALDLDGTLFNNKSQISRENIKAIKEATAAGINVVISTSTVHSEGCRLRQLRTPASATLSLQTEVQSTRLTPKNVFTKTAFLMRQRFQ